MKSKRHTTFLLAAWALAAAASAAQEPLKSPTRLHAIPDLYSLLPLPGDRAYFRYTPGSLDRSANLQSRLEQATRFFENWGGEEVRLLVYVVDRREWDSLGYRVPYGIPLRAGEEAIVAPAAGDSGTVALWSGLLGGVLPAVGGVPLMGSPREVATLILADHVAQLQAAEMLVDRLGLAGDAHWVRGVMSHLVSLSVGRRVEPRHEAELDSMYAFLSRGRTKAFASSDYHEDLPLEDWLWFQAQFHIGAKELLERLGKKAVKQLLKGRGRRGSDVLLGAELLRRHRNLNDWYHESFSAVGRGSR